MKYKDILTVMVLKVKWGREGLDKEALDMHLGLGVLIIQEFHIPSQESSSVLSDTKAVYPQAVPSRWGRMARIQCRAMQGQQLPGQKESRAEKSPSVLITHYPDLVAPQPSLWQPGAVTSGAFSQQMLSSLQY